MLRNELNPGLPVGHIHTPRIKDWQYEEVKGIVLQIEDMLKQWLSSHQPSPPYVLQGRYLVIKRYLQ